MNDLWNISEFYAEWDAAFERKRISNCKYIYQEVAVQASFRLRQACTFRSACSSVPPCPLPLQLKCPAVNKNGTSGRVAGTA